MEFETRKNEEEESEDGDGASGKRRADSVLHARNAERYKITI